MQNQFTNSNANYPPRTVGTDPSEAVYSAATAVASTATDLWAVYPLDAGGLRRPMGKIWVELEVTGFDAFVCFDRVAGTVTAANGVILRVGVPRIFYVTPERDLFLKHISPGGVGAIKWRLVSSIGERSRS